MIATDGLCPAVERAPSVRFPCVENSRSCRVSCKQAVPAVRYIAQARADTGRLAIRGPARLRRLPKHAAREVAVN